MSKLTSSDYLRILGISFGSIAVFVGLLLLYWRYNHKKIVADIAEGSLATIETGKNAQEVLTGAVLDWIAEKLKINKKKDK